MENNNYYLTIISVTREYFEHKKIEIDDKLEYYLQAANPQNMKVMLPEGLKRILALQHDEHPDGYLGNFYTRIDAGGRITLLEAELEWFRVPVRAAVLSDRPVEIDSLLDNKIEFLQVA